MEASETQRKKKKRSPFVWHKGMSLRANYARIGAMTFSDVSPKDILQRRQLMLERSDNIPFKKVNSHGLIPDEDEDEDGNYKDSDTKRPKSLKSKKKGQLDKEVLEPVDDPTDLIDNETFLPVMDPMKSKQKYGL